jgi:hypothetical protein
VMVARHYITSALWPRIQKLFLWIQVQVPTGVSAGIEILYPDAPMCFVIDHRKGMKTPSRRYTNGHSTRGPRIARVQLSPKADSTDEHLIDCIMRGLKLAAEKTGLTEMTLKLRTPAEYTVALNSMKGLEALPRRSFVEPDREEVGDQAKPYSPKRQSKPRKSTPPAGVEAPHAPRR